MHSMKLSRVPHGTRGLKSLPCLMTTDGEQRRVPHGTRGLKFKEVKRLRNMGGRVPHGTRGLKSFLILLLYQLHPVASRMGRVD